MAAKEKMACWCAARWWASLFFLAAVFVLPASANIPRLSETRVRVQRDFAPTSIRLDTHFDAEPQHFSCSLSYDLALEPTIDPDGRCAGKVANFAYNGGLAGYGLRELGGYLDSYNNSSAGGGWLTGFSGTVVNELAGASAPSTYVNGLSSYGHNVAGYYNDGGLLPATSYALTSWNVGAVYSGAANFDLHYDTAGQEVGDWYQRSAVISGGVASTAGIAAGGLSLYNWATAAPASVPPVINPADNLVDPGTLRLPPSRSGGADPFKLSQQMQQYGTSTEGMPPIQVTQGLNGEMMINDGVTRATRISTYNQINSTVNQVPVVVIEQTAQDFSHLPTVARPR